MLILSRPLSVSAALVLAGLAVGAATSAQATATGLYYERSVAVAAQSQCNYFEPRVAAALNAATLQARGAALRSGSEVTQLADTSARARSVVSGLSCSDPDLHQMASRVQAGFAGWSRAARISFPGLKSAWRGERFRAKTEVWRLVQEGRTGLAPVRVGLVGQSTQDTRLVSVVSFVGKNRPYAARIVMRNAHVMPRPWLSARSQPPPSIQTRFFASAVRTAPNALLVDGHRQGEVWAFPEAAIEALVQLDPRENFSIEFLFRDDSVATAQFEVGDFVAGRAFLAMGPI